MTFIPFLPEFLPKIRSGVKTATSRTKRYGRPGEVLEATDGIRIQLREVRETTLRNVSQYYFRQEGVSTPREFIAIWEALHSATGWTPNRKVWLHLFRYVEG